MNSRGCMSPDLEHLAMLLKFRAMDSRLMRLNWYFQGSWSLRGLLRLRIVTVFWSPFDERNSGEWGIQERQFEHEDNLLQNGIQSE